MEVCVVTNVAARGVDIPQVDHIINFDLPSDDVIYTHRIGRTARCGKKGDATSLVCLSEDSSKLVWLKKVMVDSDQEIPDWLANPDSMSNRFGEASGTGGFGRAAENSDDDWGSGPPATRSDGFGDPPPPASANRRGAASSRFAAASSYQNQFGGVNPNGDGWE